MQQISVFWFCILQLYWILLLALIVFSCISRLLCIHGILPSATDCFTSSFTIWIDCIYYSCLIALAGTSSIIVNRSRENDRLGLISGLGGKTLSFLLMSMMLAVVLWYITFIMLLCHIWLMLLSFIHVWMLDFFRFFSWVNWGDHVISFYPSFCLCGVSHLWICIYWNFLASFG